MSEFPAERQRCAVPSPACAVTAPEGVEAADIVGAWCERERAERCQDYAAATYGALSYLPSLVHPDAPAEAVPVDLTRDDLARLAALAAQAAATAQQWHRLGWLPAPVRARVLFDLRVQAALVPAEDTPARRTAQRRLDTIAAWTHRAATSDPAVSGPTEKTVF